jgi:hypothetical protein
MAQLMMTTNRPRKSGPFNFEVGPFNFEFEVEAGMAKAELNDAVLMRAVAALWPAPGLDDTRLS